MKKKLIISLFVLFLFSNITAQTTDKKKGFIALHFGEYGVLSESFTKYYGSRFGYFFGGNLGIPLSAKVSLFGKVSYFQKEGIPIYEVTGLREGSAILKEGIIDFGIQVRYFLVGSIHLIIISGITIAVIDEERFSPTHQFTYETEGNGNFGIILGGAIEISLGKSPFSIVNEVNYIYSWKPVLEYENTYQALNLTTGLRLYFGG